MAQKKFTLPSMLDATEFRRRLKSCQISGGYLFVGEEQYLKRHCLHALRDTILPDPALTAFNHFRLTYPEMTHDDFMNALEALPMMATQKLVEIHEIPFGSMGERELDDLITDLTLLSAYPDTVLVLYAMPEEWDTQSDKFQKLMVRFAEVTTPVVFAKETPARLAKWIRQHFSAKGITIGDDHVDKIRTLCGNNMDTLASEIEKLTAYLGAHEEHVVTDAAIGAVISNSFEIGMFDFANAILAGQCGKAYQYFYTYKLERTPEELLLGQIVRVYHLLSVIKVFLDSGATPDEIAAETGIKPGQIKLYLPAARTTTAEVLADAVACCMEADRALKLRASDGYMLLEFLIAKVALRRRMGRKV